MKNVFTFGLLIIVIYLQACHYPMDVQYQKKTIELLSPIDEEIVDYCCFTFTWQSNFAADDYHIILSGNNNFTPILLDTIVSTLDLNFTSRLNPGKKYYWKSSSQTLNAEAVDSFYVKDYAGFFQGSYPVTVTIQEWNYIDGVTWDSTFMGNCTITKITEEMVQVYESVTGKGRIFTYLSNLATTPNEIGFLYNDASRSSICSFNFATNTFGAGVTEGGVGIRTYYSFRGMK